MTSSEDIDPGDRLRENGWRQGALIERSLSLNEQSSYFIVASQDCDIVAPLCIEPRVDLLPADLQENPAPDLLYGKNPRRLCVPLEDGRYACVDARDRTTVAKSDVADCVPQRHLKTEGRSILARWLGKRYRRPAFPDEFNRRLDGQRKQIEKLLKQEISKAITGIYAQFVRRDGDPDEVVVDEIVDYELGEGEEYRLVLWFTCRKDEIESAERRALCEEHVGKIAQAFNNARGVRVEEYELKTHGDVTLEDLELMKRFDWDFRSEEGNKPGGEMAPEM